MARSIDADHTTRVLAEAHRINVLISEGREIIVLSPSEVLESALGAHVEVVLENCRIALSALAVHHAYLADHSDMDLNADTRWAARWRLAGAAIAYSHALHAQHGGCRAGCFYRAER